MSNRSTGNAEHVSYLFLGDLCSTSWSFETNLMCLLMTMRRHIKSIKAPSFVFLIPGPIIEEIVTLEFIDQITKEKAADQRFRLKGKQAPSGWYKFQ